METIEYWTQLVGGAVRLKNPNDALSIAQLCYVAERKGEVHNVWHMTAQFYGYADRCHCAICERARKAVRS